MKEETNPDPVLILPVFEKAKLNTFRKKSTKQKSRAVISTRDNLFELQYRNLLRMLRNKLKTVSSENDEVAIHSGKNYYEKFKKRNSKIPRTYEIRTAVPYLRTLAIFRWKTFRNRFLYLSFFYSASNIQLFLSIEYNSLFLVFSGKDKKLKVCLIFCRNTILQPPGVRLRTLTSLAVLSNPWDSVSCDIGSTIRLWAV